MRDVAAVAGSNRRLRVAATAPHAVPHSVRTSANTHPGATRHPHAVGGTTASSGTATSAIREIGPAGATAERRPGWAAPTANFRLEDPAAAPTRIAATAAELPAAERDAAAPITDGAAEPTVGGQGATTRRPTAITRRMAHTILAAEPQLSRTELASRLGVSTRRLREVLTA